MRTSSLPQIAVLSILAVVAVPAAAQFKWVAPDGAVTYSDQPPPPGMEGAALRPVEAPRESRSPVPAALRQASSKYPTVLYTTAECTPCQVARGHLERRGIPFTEKTVRTASDAEAFKRLGFSANSFPSISVGRERSVGYESGEWDRMLDLAGYPQTSVLPPAFRQQPAQPLAEKAPERPTDGKDAGGIAGAESRETVARDISPAARQRGVVPRPIADGTAPPPPQRGAVNVRF
jgi:glutaredoxin